MNHHAKQAGRAGWRRRAGILLLLLAAAVLLAMGYRPLLRAAARPLICDQSPRGEFLCLQGDERGASGEKCLDRAADWCREASSHRILLLAPCRSRIVQIGAVASFEENSRRALARLGVPDRVIQPIPGAGRDDWERAGLLKTFLADHPRAELALVCSRFRGGLTRHVLDAVLGAEAATRVTVLGLPSAAYDETCWWRSRDGMKEFAYAWLGLACAWWEGADRVVPQPWTVAEYQALLGRTFGEAPR
ncbi:MAG: hypothetical protein ABSF26_13085 [Thermoguttaceae bacterium]